MLGTSAAAMFAAGCLGGCAKSEAENPQPGGGTGTPNKKDFTLNLALPANATLKTPGNALISNSVIVAYTNNLQYVAVASICTHQGGTILYDATEKKFICPVHGSVFNQDGSVINGPAVTALKQFKTTLSGTNLRVYED